MRIAFRVDASPESGLGHVVRMRNLAAEVRARGAEVVFLCEAPTPAVADLLAGYDVLPLPAGLSDADDARNVLQALGAGADAVMLDHYKLGQTWERLVRKGVPFVAAMEDIPTRRHDVDMLVDQNYSLSFAQKYKGLLPATARTYFGPRYALLSRAYCHDGAVLAPRRDGPKRILISFGGTDATDVTGQAFAALAAEAWPDVAFEVVVGASYPHRAALEAAVARVAGATLHVQLPTLAPLLDTVDLAVGAAGVSAWERFAKGVPTILVTLEDNQYPASCDLHTSGIAVHLGRAATFDAEMLKKTARDLLDHPERRAQMSRQGRILVDGRGAQRIAEALCPTPKSP